MDNLSNYSFRPTTRRCWCCNTYYWEMLVLLSKEPALTWLNEVLFPRPGSGQAHAVAGNRIPPPRARPHNHRAASPLSLSDDDPSVLEVGEAYLEAAAPGGHRSDRAPSGGEGRRNHGAAGEPLHESQTCRDPRQHPLGPWPLATLRLVARAGPPRIWKAYFRSLCLFVAFREEMELPSIWPIPGNQIRGFLVALDHQGISSPKILMYLAGLSYISRMFNFQDPLQDFLTSRMVLSLRWRRLPQMEDWHPLTIEMLRCLVGTVETVCSNFYECLLFHAVFTLAFFGALRPEEIVAEHCTRPNPELLQLSDFYVLDNSIGIRQRVSERSVVHLRLSREHWVCPVLAFRNFLAVRPRGDGPFFIYGNRQLLSKERFLAVFYSALRILGIPPQQYSIHSFWMGSVVSAVRYRYPQEVILRLAHQSIRSSQGGWP